MFMEKQSLGDVIFSNNPKNHGLPEPKKTISNVPTYSGSAVFQWAALLAGTEVVLTWDWMLADEYDSIRAMCISMDTYVWQSQFKGYSFNVIPGNINGVLLDHALDNVPYRKNVTLPLNIRSMV